MWWNSLLANLIVKGWKQSMREPTEVQAEQQAWEFLAEQFALAEAGRYSGDFVSFGLCYAVLRLRHTGRIGEETRASMNRKIAKLDRMRSLKERTAGSYFAPTIFLSEDSEAARAGAGFRASLCALAASGALDTV